MILHERATGQVAAKELASIVDDARRACLSLLCRRHPPPSAAGRRGRRRARGPFGKLPYRGIARVVDYIESGIDQDLRLKTLADIAGMSVYHFSRRFRETVGRSPHAYVLARRMARARAMLSRNDIPLAQVALACGFASQALFTTAFHRSLGITPGSYRRRVR
jgi:AraC family transcriptional regulator